MKEIEILETAFQKPVEEWNVSDLAKFLDNDFAEKYSPCLTDQAVTECITRLSSVNGDVELLNSFQTLRIHNATQNAMILMSDIIIKRNNDEIDDKCLEEELLKYIENEDKFVRSATYMTLISLRPDFDIKPYEDKIKSTMEEIKTVLCAVVSRCESAYDLLTMGSVIENVSNLMFQLRAKYFEKYEVDVIDDTDENLKACIDLVNSWSLELQEALLKEQLKSEDLAAISDEIGEHDHE